MSTDNARYTLDVNFRPQNIKYLQLILAKWKLSIYISRLKEEKALFHMFHSTILNMEFCFSII